MLCGSRSVLECRDPLLLGDRSQLGGTLKVSPSRMTVSKPVEVFRGADERVGRTQMGSLGPFFGELYSLPIHTPMLRLGTSGLYACLTAYATATGPENLLTPCEVCHPVVERAEPR